MQSVGCGGAVVDELEQASTMQCPSQTLEGVDVYQGDGVIDWNQVKTSGRAFAFMKASQGDYNKQSNFSANWANTQTVGIRRGAYHYFDATVDGVKQAQWFLTQLTLAGGLEPGDLPPALDLECPTSTVASDPGNLCLGNGSSGWAPTATVIQRTWDWLTTVEAATQMRPIIYSYPSWFATFGFTDPRLTAYPLWIASPYSTTCATVPAPWTKATFWQYSSKTQVPGIGGGISNVDVDRFIGGETEMNTFVATDVAQGGSDGGSDGGVDLARPAVDLAQADDLASPASADLAAAPDLRSNRPHGGDGGCSCQLGGRAAPLGARWLVLLVALAALRRRARPQTGPQTSGLRPQAEA
jgi:lysozyme